MIRNSSLTRLLLPKTSRTFYDVAKKCDPQDLNPGEAVSKWKAALEMELDIRVPKYKENASIYRVPRNMREVQPNAYAPNIISIGPYHHGQEALKDMEELKWEFFHRLFRPKRPNGVELDPVMKALEDLEQDARRCYWDNAKQHSKDKFVRMMLVDGCFIVELFRGLQQNNFHYAPFVKRWMLPTLRRDLIMLENQLPLFVLEKLFELTKKSEETTSTSTSLEGLALHFFSPLLQRESNSDMESRITALGIKKRQHFLDLFRLSILPRNLLQADETGKTKNIAEEGIISTEGTDMMRSTIELMEAGVVIKKAVNCPPLDVRSERCSLKIPPLYIDDYKGTLFRNMVAYEQCNPKCKPYVTSYLFFFDGLINSAHDVELLHHKGVLHHSLGNNKEVARLVNGLCKEIARDNAWESYLHKVVSDVDTYYHSYYARIRARLVHHYFSNWVVGISTIGAIIVLYLTLLQTAFSFAGDAKNIDGPFHRHLMECLFHPISDFFSKNKKSGDAKNIDGPFHLHIMECLFHPISDFFYSDFFYKNKKIIDKDKAGDPQSHDATVITHWMISI